MLISKSLLEVARRFHHASEFSLPPTRLSQSMEILRVWSSRLAVKLCLPVGSCAMGNHAARLSTPVYGMLSAKHGVMAPRTRTAPPLRAPISIFQIYRADFCVVLTNV